MTDFCSFYHLPSTVIGNKLHNRLNAVYSYYNVATSVPILDLMRDLLVSMFVNLAGTVHVYVCMLVV